MNNTQIMDLHAVKDLTIALLWDFGRLCNVDVTRDVETFETRVSNEGQYFVTRALLAYGRDLLRAIDCGRCSSGMFRNFKRIRHGGYPLFLRGFLERIFSPNGDVLPREELDVNCFKAVYQIALSWYKHEVDCSEDIVRKQYSDYLILDNMIGDIKARDGSRSQERKAIKYHMSLVLDQVLLGFNGKNNIFPVHGSGATSEGVNSPF